MRASPARVRTMRCSLTSRRYVRLQRVWDARRRSSLRRSALRTLRRALTGSQSLTRRLTRRTSRMRYPRCAIFEPCKPSALSCAVHNLCQALYSRLFDVLVETINTSLMFGGASRYFIGAVDIFGFECFPHNSLEQERSRSKPSHVAHRHMHTILTCTHDTFTHAHCTHACTHAHTCTHCTRIHLCPVVHQFCEREAAAHVYRGSVRVDPCRVQKGRHRSARASSNRTLYLHM